jgi:RNA polymerase sigma-32 factor
MGPDADRLQGNVTFVPFGGQRLPAVHERALLRTVRHDANDQARQRALAELWEAHRGLVASVASRYRRAGVETADLIGVGQLGLHTAILRFDPDRFPGRLSTYAVPWIRWYVQDHINRNATPVRLPSTSPHRQLARWGTRLFEDARLACQREQVPATEAELCARVGRRIGLSAEEVERSRLMAEGAAVGLDMLPSIAADADPVEATPEDAAIERLDREKLRRRILALADSILGERERSVFLARCMTGSEPVVHLDTLATRFGVSRERIYQLEGSARRKIMTALRHEGFTGLPDQTFVPSQSGGAGQAAVQVRSR